jgi:GNAT superfamily N-acetyltransferase
MLEFCRPQGCKLVARRGSACLRTFSVRPALPGDEAGIQEIFAANISAAKWLPVAARGRTNFSDVSADETILVAVDDVDTIAGFVSVQPEAAFIHHLHVRAGARGTGAGRCLLTALASCLDRPWHLKCVANNVDALAFYRRVGWNQISTGESDDGAYVLLEWFPNHNG